MENLTLCVYEKEKGNIHEASKGRDPQGVHVRIDQITLKFFVKTDPVFKKTLCKQKSDYFQPYHSDRTEGRKKQAV